MTVHISEACITTRVLWRVHSPRAVEDGDIVVHDEEREIRIHFRNAAIDDAAGMVFFASQQNVKSSEL